MITALAAERPAWLHAAAVTVFLLASAPNMALMAQGLNAESTIDAIVGSEVTTGEEAVAADQERIVAAIDNTRDNIAEVRKRFSIDHVEIVFLPDFDKEETVVDAKMAELKPEIAQLRSEIQGSAIFYHAVNSRQVLLNDIIALDFDDKNGVTIFVAGREPGGSP